MYTKTMIIFYRLTLLGPFSHAYANSSYKMSYNYFPMLTQFKDETLFFYTYTV